MTVESVELMGCDVMEENHHRILSGGGDGEIHVTDESALTLLITVMLLVGGICRWISTKLHIPYTPLLLAMGALISWKISKYIHVLAQGYEMFLLVDPHGLLAVLVPIILFEPGLLTNFHSAWKLKSQILILCLPVFFITTCISTLGLSLFYFNDDELRWPMLFTISTLVSITDPVDIIHHLQHEGAKNNLINLMTLESLFNDGTGIIFFILFSEMSVSVCPQSLSFVYIG
jgi:NhaP-type Na+/H+ or K+/H+ antiporter